MDNRDPHRPARNMQALLKFCTELTATEDRTMETNLPQDSERREFLENALQGMQTDTVKDMQRCIGILSTNVVTMIDRDVSEQVEALEELEDYLEDINHAIDFHKLGGFPVIVTCLTSPHSSLRTKAAGRIGDLCQNNKYCQTEMIKIGVLKILLKMIDADENETCRVKALYALSCVIRDFNEGENEFVSSDGLSVLMRAMQSHVEKLLVKAAFLLKSLINNNEICRELLLKMGFVELLCKQSQMAAVCCQEGDSRTSDGHAGDIYSSTCSELSTLCLLTLCRCCPQAIDRCHQVSPRLISTLKQRKTYVKDKEEFMDEEGYIEELLKLMTDSHEGEEGEEFR